ncbi:MAG: F0F1 ATP synthase subunit B [Planctomycetia bacterium]|nr:F0F1 ATP synthase subunit B [Planctomycetia bacterium]
MVRLRNSFGLSFLAVAVWALLASAVFAQDASKVTADTKTTAEATSVTSSVPMVAPAKAEEKHDTSVPLNAKPDLAVWSFITFLIFLAVLRKFAWSPLIGALDQREHKMKQALADAESARIKAEAMLAEHAKKLEKVQDEVKEILAEARRDAEHTKQDIVATANKEAEATRKRAVEDIEHARDLAMKELFDFVSSNVIGATEHVLGRALSDDDQTRLVQEALNQMGSKT